MCADSLFFSFVILLLLSTYLLLIVSLDLIPRHIPDRWRASLRHRPRALSGSEHWPRECWQVLTLCRTKSNMGPPLCIYYQREEKVFLRLLIGESFFKVGIGFAK